MTDKDEQRVLRIVVASPGDVKAERDALSTVVEEINNNVAADRGLYLKLARWETDSYPGFHADGPQGLIDPILRIEESDVLIGIFWKRFGTPTGDAQGGTEHEFRLAYGSWEKKQRPQIMVYFNQKSYTPKSREETDQWSLVLKFRDEFPKQGLWWPYNGVSEFERLVRRHLSNYLREKYPLHPEARRNAERQIIRDAKLKDFSDDVLQEDWGDEVDVSIFYGRRQQLEQLRKMIVDDHCRVVTILGMGGIGKTALSIKMAQQVKHEFKYLFRQELKNAPSVKEVLVNCVKFLSGHTSTNLPIDLDKLIDLLIKSLKQFPCLIILDNAEEILKAGEHTGRYREGYEGYGVLLRRVGETAHQSCLVLTSREKPQQVAILEGKTSPVRSLILDGLEVKDGVNILKDKGIKGTRKEYQKLVELYKGNALALKIVPDYIREAFDGDISAFLKAEVMVVGDIRYLLDKQIKRLTEIERGIMYWLAINREPVGRDELQDDFAYSVKSTDLIEAITSLSRRSLIEKSAEKFMLQPAVMEYVTELFVERASEWVASQDTHFLDQYTFIKAQAKDYVRSSQIRLILGPIGKRLLSCMGRQELRKNVHETLDELRSDELPGYAASNILSLLIQLRESVRDYDFSSLVLKQAYLQGVDLRDTQFAHSRFEKAVFTNIFGSVTSVRFSPEGNILAVGCGDGTVRYWRIEDAMQLHVIHGHPDWVRAVAFHPHGNILASGSDDKTIKFWDVETGKNIKELKGHASRIFSVAFAPDGELIASCDGDGIVKVWNTRTGHVVVTLDGHPKSVLSVAFSPDGTKLASAGEDKTVRVWDVLSWKCLFAYEEHTDHVYSISFSNDNQFIASAGRDRVIRVWSVETGLTFRELKGHLHTVLAVAFSPTSLHLASGSIDQTVRIWDVERARIQKSVEGHDNWVNDVTYDPDGATVATGSADQTVRLWDARSGSQLRTMQGYTSPVWSVALNPCGKNLASGHGDDVIRLWDLEAGACFRILRGHTDWVWAVAFYDDEILASGSGDRTICLWNTRTGEPIKQFRGHEGGVRGLAFSPDRKILASSSMDNTIRIWDIETGQCLRSLEGHTNLVESVTFRSDGCVLASCSADQSLRLWNAQTGEQINLLGENLGRVRFTKFNSDGSLLAASSDDCSIKIWDMNSGECIRVLQDHTDRVTAFDFGPDNSLVSCSVDKTIRLWNVATGKCIKILTGHNSQIRTVIFDSGAESIISGGLDETIKIWDAQSGLILRTLQSERPYQRMNITGVVGLSHAQIMILRGLGAISST